MRPNTLAEAVERIEGGIPQDVALAEFVDTFDLAPTIDAKYATIEREPPLSRDPTKCPGWSDGRISGQKPSSRSRSPLDRGAIAPAG